MKNKARFETSEFDVWASKTGLNADEAFLFERYLHTSGHTLEAGTGGGRLLLALQERGVQQLSGFDYISEMVDQARLNDPSRSIDFQVMDARKLAYPSAHFDQVLYLQQLLSVIDPEDFDTVIGEAFRVLKPGGTAFFSFLLLQSRLQSLPYACFLHYLKGIRRIAGRTLSWQFQPWLKNGTQPNLSALLDRPPYVYWFAVSEAIALVEQAGFEIVWQGTSHQIRAGIENQNPEPSQASDKLYLVCRK